MADRARMLRVVITGDAKGALDAFGDVESGAGGLGSRLRGVGTAAAVGFAAVGAGAVAAGAALYQIGDTFDSAVDTIRVGTGATGAELDALEEAFKSVFASTPTDAESAATAIADLNAALGLTGEPLEHISQQMLELSRITETDVGANIEAAAGMLNNWGVSVDEQGAQLDRLFRVSQATGVGFDQLSSDLAQHGVVLRSVGLNADQAASLIGLLAKEGMSVTDVMPAFQRAMATAAEQGITAEEALSQTWETIANAPDSIAAAQAAVDVFGARAGPRMAEMIRQGKLSYEELTATIQAGGDTILGAGEDTKDFAEQWQQFQNRVLVALAPLAEQVFSAAGDAMEALAPHVENVVEWLADRLPTAIARVRDIWDEWSPRLQAGFERVSEVATTAWGAVETIIDRVASLFRREGGEGGMAGTASRVGNVVSQMGETFRSVFTFIETYVSKVVEIVTALWDRFGEDLLSRIQPFLDGVLRAFEGFWTVIQGIFEFFTSILTGDWSAAWEAIKTIVSGAWDVINGIVNAGWQALLGLWDIITGTLDATWDWAWNAMSTLLADIWEGIRRTVESGLNAVVGFFADLPGRIWGAITGLFSLGQDIVRGIWDGIASMGSWLWDNITGFVSRNIPGPVKSILGISSPSRVMADIAEEIPAGMAVGISRGAPAVSKEMELLAGMVMGSLATRLTAMGVNPRNPAVFANMTATAHQILAGQQLGTLFEDGSATFRSGPVINIQATPGTDRRALGREIVDLIAEHERAGGRRVRVG